MLQLQSLYTVTARTIMQKPKGYWEEARLFFLDKKRLRWEIDNFVTDTPDLHLHKLRVIA